jgi:HEAT repeat protein
MNLSPIILSAFGLVANPQESSLDDEWSVRSPMRVRLEEVLEDLDKGFSRQEVMEQLVALGPSATPEVVDILMGPDPVPKTDDFAKSMAKRDSGHRELLIDALKAWPVEETVEGVHRYILDNQAGMEFDAQLLALTVLGQIGNANALDPVFDVISRADPVHLLRPLVKSKIEAALAAILERDEQCTRLLMDRLKETQVELWPSLARAVGANLGHDGIGFLEGMLGQDEMLDRIVLEQLSHLDQRDWPEHLSRAADILRIYLRSADGELRKQAVTSLGELRYVDAFDEMAMLTADVDRRVQQAAARALQEVTGLSWRADAQEWQAWFASQRAWLARVTAETAGDVLDGDPSRAIRAIRTLSERPVFRNQVSEIIAQATRHPEPGVVSFACTALTALDSPYSLEPLLELLLHDSKTVRTAAHAGLRRISGQELPPEYVVWSDWIGG